MTKTRRLALVLSASLIAGIPLGSSSCKNLPSGTPIVSTLGPLGLCVVQTALSDIVEIIADPVALIGLLISSCSAYGVATVEQIITWVELALSSQPAPADAGPMTAANVSISKARLNKVRAAALTQLHIIVNVAPAPATSKP